MEIGEYIRTRLGISKIIGRIGPNVYEVDKNGHHMGHRFSDYVEDDEILKHSINVIELIEAGDYVNGYKVSFKDNDYKPFIQCDYPVQEGTTNHYKFYEKAIESIVTKEQFKSMQYKLEAEGK